MGKCDKIEDTCGKKINARCVKYEGEINEQSSLEEDDCLNVHNTTEDIYEQLEDIQCSIDLSALGDKCIDYTQKDEDKLKVAEALLGLEEKLCEIVGEVAPVEGACHPVFDADITCVGLDLECLELDPCDNPITTFKDLLQALITKVCE